MDETRHVTRCSATDLDVSAVPESLMQRRSQLLH